ncbi:MAG: GFA family protein [Cyanobacteria bacterium J083]|nr:MAG: GFA family protein [Cyanobacteria bacterium J083]
MSSSKILKGSCLCGAVKLSTTRVNKHLGACHCRICRKWGGSALLAVECRSEVNFSGAENIGIYPSSAWAERGFCRQCGSHLFYRLKQNHQYYIPVGIFENSEDFIFDHQLFIDHKPAYYTFANETKNMTGAEVFAQFTPPATQ